MAAAALRSAARKVCGSAFERPQAYFRTAASAALKEEQGRLLPRISRGGSSLRWFSSSESPNVLNNKQGAKPSATIADEVLPHNSSSLVKDPDCNIRVMVPPWFPGHPKYLQGLITWIAGTLVVTYAVVYLEAKFIFKRPLLGGYTESRKSNHGSCTCRCCVH